ncbi:MAG: hypothetical protein HQ542_08325 [Bacteroidia bacterium]|nr:hypothetical protein [Bacteroidia bacterium]
MDNYCIRHILKAVANRTFRRSIIRRWERAGKPAPTPHLVKQAVVEDYKAISGYNILVETGTFLGDMVDAQKNNFNRIYSIELSEKYWLVAKKRFKRQHHITLIYGDSGKVLNEIAKELTEPAIFWLDGHFQGGQYAKGVKDSPVLEEIDAIFNNRRFNHIILVDDARFFKGRGDYPTIEELTAYIKGKEKKYEVDVRDDIIRYTIPAN